MDWRKRLRNLMPATRPERERGTAQEKADKHGYDITFRNGLWWGTLTNGPERKIAVTGTKRLGDLHGCMERALERVDQGFAGEGHPRGRRHA